MYPLPDSAYYPLFLMMDFAERICVQGSHHQKSMFYEQPVCIRLIRFRDVLKWFYWQLPCPISSQNFFFSLALMK
jgi:hypothetical protein